MLGGESQIEFRNSIEGMGMYSSYFLNLNKVLIIIIKNTEIIAKRIKRGITYCSMPKSSGAIFSPNNTTKNPGLNRHSVLVKTIFLI